MFYFRSKDERLFAHLFVHIAIIQLEFHSGGEKFSKSSKLIDSIYYYIVWGRKCPLGRFYRGLLPIYGQEKQLSELGPNGYYLHYTNFIARRGRNT